jgi:hypothetical protein
MGRPTVSFTNSTGAKINVAYMRRDFDCREACGDIWDVLGWINLDPGETETRSNQTNNRWFYYYAESDNGAIWSGVFSAEVTNTVFQKCKCQVSEGYRTVGFDVLDTDVYPGVNFI